MRCSSRRVSLCMPSSKHTSFPETPLSYFGVGPIGLVVIQMLNVCGASHVVAVDIDDYRLGLAENYGAIPLNPTKLDHVG